MQEGQGGISFICGDRLDYHYSCVYVSKIAFVFFVFFLFCSELLTVYLCTVYGFINYTF